MKNATILAVLNHETDDQYIEGLAEAFVPLNMYLACFVMSPGVDLPAAVYGIPPYGSVEISDDWKQLLDDALDLQKRRVDEVEQVLARCGVSGEVQALLCSTSDTRDHIARRARLSDLTVLAPNLRNTPHFMNEAAQGVLFRSASGLMLNANPAARFDRILVAWDSSDTAARAVRAALPYLKQSNEVAIACFDPVASETQGEMEPGADVASWLSHHGCNVVLSQYPSGGEEIGACIQGRAREFGADLIVMGAYGHSRLLQAVFGGTTRALLEQADLPVLMAH